MNSIPVIHLDHWVRREEQVSLVNFSNTRAQLQKESRSDTGLEWDRKSTALMGESCSLLFD